MEVDIVGVAGITHGAGVLTFDSNGGGGAVLRHAHPDGDHSEDDTQKAADKNPMPARDQAGEKIGKVEQTRRLFNLRLGFVVIGVDGFWGATKFGHGL